VDLVIEGLGVNVYAVEELLELDLRGSTTTRKLEIRSAISVRPERSSFALDLSAPV